MLIPGPALIQTAANPTYRKVTAKVVNGTVAATDLLNGEISIPANAMTATSLLRMTAFGDWLQNSGGAASGLRFQLLFGGTTIFDTGTLANAANSATRGSWDIEAKIFNTSTSAQVCYMNLTGNSGGGWSASVTAAFTTGQGDYNAGFGASGAKLLRAQGYNSVAVDTTLARAVVLNIINGSASGSYETTLKAALFEII